MDKAVTDERIILEAKTGITGNTKIIQLTNKRLIVEDNEIILLEDIEEAYTSVNWAGIGYLTLRLKDGTERKYNIREGFKWSKFFGQSIESTCLDSKTQADRWVNAINRLLR